MTPDKDARGARVGDSPLRPGEPATFRDVLRAEWAEVRGRRRLWDTGPRAGEDGDPDVAPPDLVGVALSGGGIRSATFALGLLQRMAHRGVLPAVDYLSTVSGGGFTGGWWSAWLSRSGRRERDIFPPHERVEPERWREYMAASCGEAGASPEASLSARQNDPIHHLRLFANYLTPRKGLLSADSWRAATVVSRNLILTWLVLLPVLLAAVVAGQIYFTLAVDPQENFLATFPVAAPPADAAAARADPPAAAVADVAALRAQAELARERAEGVARQARMAAIGERAMVAARPLLVLLIWAALLTLVWMLHGSGGGRWTFLATLAGVGATLFIGWTLYGAVDAGAGGGPSLLTPGWLFLLVAGAAILLIVCRALPTYLFMPRRDGVAGGLPEDLLRNRVVRAHGAVLVTLLLVGGALLVAGFSHDLVWFLFDPASGGPLPTWVKQVGGWGAAIATVAAMLFTGFSGAPAGGEGKRYERPGMMSRAVYAAAPPAALSLLAVLAAIAGRALIGSLANAGSDMPRLDAATILAISLFLAFAIYESHDRAEGDPVRGWRRATAPAAGAAVTGLFLLLGPGREELALRGVVLWIGLAWVLLLLGLPGVADAVTRRQESAAAPRAERPSGPEAGHLFLGAALLLLSLLGWIGWHLLDPGLAGTRHLALRPDDWGGFVFPGTAGFVPPLLLGAALGCGVFAATEARFTPSGRRRALALLSISLAAISTRAILPFLPLEAGTIAHSSAAATVVILALAWVVGLGWMANPNMLSLHAFYRARLVRGYMGASNPERSTEQITESAPGDDLPLANLANCDVGAPYQLINTTLNLVGGRDLSTVQRSADSFLMSRHYCGSARTGFRPTREYMAGSLTLGTAVAISGAAASPNMGSQTPSAALSMLLALLNVRLAFWAATPNLPFWRDSRPRLWPFYVLRELLSQTNELSPYCCLSDGGHFDNTGLYSLVSRGCRYIVLSDCGADPKPCFEDIGNAIRRCRIDFGAQIDLRIDPFLPAEESGAAAHFTVGSITYAEAHARALGWPDPEIEANRHGVVVWIKPSLTLSDEPADLRQYARQHPVFPQQPTSDQWYDEAQFESYRCLGEHTADQVFDGFPAAGGADEVREFFTTLHRSEHETPRPTHFNLDVTTIAGKPVLQVVEVDGPAVG